MVEIGSDNKTMNWENENIRTKRFTFQIDIDLNEEQQKCVIEKINRELKNHFGTKYNLKKYFLDNKITVIAERV